MRREEAIFIFTYPLLSAKTRESCNINALKTFGTWVKKILPVTKKNIGGPKKQQETDIQ